MFDEPSESPEPRPVDPVQRARDKSDEFRMHAELAAVFEGVRKFGAQMIPSLDADVARSCQRAVAKLEKSRMDETPLLSADGQPAAAELFDLLQQKEISTNDYHIYRRPGEVMILRWLSGEEVEAFYERLQAHFDSALGQYRDDQRQTHEWKQDAQSEAYLKALDAIDVKMAERYVRPVIKEHPVFVLSTQTADEMDILHLCDYIMGVPAAEIVGTASAPPLIEPTEQDRAWFFKLFSLRGRKNEAEVICFFTYMQKTDDSADW